MKRLLLLLILTTDSAVGDGLRPLNTEHLSTLSNAQGLCEFARGTTPQEGRRCIEDTARALVAVLEMHAVAPTRESRRLAGLYLGAIAGLQQDDGRLHFGFGGGGEPLERMARGDSFSRTLWGLGHASAHGVDQVMRERAAEMFLKALRHAKAQLGNGVIENSYAVQGLHCFLEAHPDEADARRALRRRADLIVAKLPDDALAPWQWPSGVVSYDSARLPVALLLAYQTTKDERYREAGIRVLRFLAAVNFPDDGAVLHVIGNDGWYRRGQPVAKFDQQPIDASSLVEACALAWTITGEEVWRTRTRSAFAWFSGRNTRSTPIYDPESGGCRDGLGPNGANGNQGGESTVSYWIARCVMEGVGKE